MRFAVLGSGSNANSYIFEDETFGFLIDNGFSLKEMMYRARELEYDVEKLHFILLTHTHEDHVRGAGQLSRKLGIPVVMHKNTSRKAVRRIDPHSVLEIVPGETYSYGGLSFIPFSTYHDADHSVGYYFTIGGKSFTLLTDTGKIPEEAKPYISRSDVLFLESNYDEQMLADGPYPAFLKKRIASGRGHLSNCSAAGFLEGLDDGDGPSLVYLCHLSDTNNTAERVRESMKRVMEKGNRKIIICRKGEAIQGENHK